MFYPAKMKKIEVLALDRYQERIVEMLHGLGTIEIIGNQEKSDAEVKSGRRGLLLSELRKAEGLLDLLSEYETADKLSMRELLFKGPKPFQFNEDLLSLKPARSYLADLERKVKNKRNRHTRLEAEIEKRSETSDTLKKLEEFDLDLSNIRDTSSTFSFMGEIKKEQLNSLEGELKTFTVYLSLREMEEQVVLIIIGLDREKDRVLGALLRNGFTRLRAPGVKGTPRELFPKYSAAIKGLIEERTRIASALTDIANKEVNNLLALREYLAINLERTEIIRKFGRSQRTFTLTGYIPEKQVEKTKERIIEISEGHAFVKVVEPKEEREAIPVMFDNPEPFRAFQMLTRAYAMPRYGEADPTVLMALWFPFFFGIMLTDAAYGVGVLLLSWFLLRRFESAGIRDMGKILMFSAVWTVFLGVAFGSVFGNLLQQFFHTSFGVFDPLNRAGMGLLIAILLGAVHLNIGLYIGLEKKLRNGDLRGLLFEHIWIVLLEIAVLFFLLDSWMSYLLFTWGWRISTLVALFILIKKAGVFGLLEIPGILGSSLSYARLLALALATTGIALAVNIIGGLLLGSVVGSVLGILILFGGHLFNFAINSFGAFVHSMRLHYVEFFGMFYEGGGKEFSPFKAKRKYTKKGG